MDMGRGTSRVALIFSLVSFDAGHSKLDCGNLCNDPIFIPREIGYWPMHTLSVLQAQLSFNSLNIIMGVFRYHLFVKN